MFKKFIVSSFLVVFLSPVFAFAVASNATGTFDSAANYADGALLRAKGDIKVYLIKNNIKRWVSSLEVFDFHGFKWQNVKVISKKEVSAIKEGNPIVLETASPAPSATASGSPAPAPSTTPTVSVLPVPPVPVKARINDKLPAVEYARADWLIFNATSNYGRVGQRIIFKYSEKEKDRIENFNLYEKKPGSEYFYKIAAFEEILSTGCEDVDIDGEWMITEAGQCGYWSIQRIVPPARLSDGQGGRGTTVYLPASDYSVGEYIYYVAGADKDGLESPPSSETKLVFLDPAEILSPIHNKQIDGISPIFKWTVTDKWPSSTETAEGKSTKADYFVMISDNENAVNPLWTKQLKIPLGETGKQIEYDGIGLDPSSRYKVNIHGHYRKSDDNPDYISISSNNPEFWVKKPGWTSVFENIFSAIFNPVYQLLTAF